MEFEYYFRKSGKGGAVTGSQAEAQFLARIMKLAKEHGWLAYHVPDSRGTAEGFPDLCCVHPTYGGFFAELKTATGKRTMAQVRWGEMIHRAGWRYYLWRPEHWPEIVRTLEGR